MKETIAQATGADTAATTIHGILQNYIPPINPTQEKEVKDLEKKLKILENKNDDLHRKIVKKTTDLETAYDNQKMEYEETMTSERKEWDTKKTAFKTTAEKLRGDLDSSRSERDDFWEQVRDLQVAKAEVTRLKELSEKLAGTQKKELETQKQHLHEQSHDIKNLTSQSARLQQSLRQGQSYYDGLTAQLDVALGKLNVMTAGSGGHQLQIYLYQIEELKLTKKDVTQERDTIRTNLHSLEEELNNLKTIEKDSKAEIDRIFGLYESTKNNLDEVRDNLSKESLRLLHWQQRSELQSSTIERFQTDYEEIEDSHDWYKETLETNKEYLTEYTERNTMLLDSNSSLTESLRIANEGWDTERRELNDRIENLSLEKSKVISEYEEKIEQWKPLSSELDHLRKLSLGWDNMMMQLQELHGAGTLPTHTPTPRPSRIEASRSSMPLEQSILPPPRSISRSVEQPRRSRSPGPMQRRLSNVSSSSGQSHRLPYQPRASPSGSSISETALRRPSWRDRRPQSVEQLRRSHSPSISN